MRVISFFKNGFPAKAMNLIYTSGVRPGFEYLCSAVGEYAEKKEHVWVIIPDQMAVTVEDALSRGAPPSAQLWYDIVSFNRLADNIFRREGGVSYHYADRAAEAVVMWRALSACRDNLLVYGDTATPETVPIMMNAVNELKQSMIPPEDLMRAAVRLSESSPAKSAKYIDLANIYEVYNELLTESYDDRSSALTSAVERIRGGDFFSDSGVIIFAFSGFTAQQCAMIREAVRGAVECTVIFTVPGDAHNIGLRPEFDGIIKTKEKLRAIASAVRVPCSVEIIERGSEGEIDTLVDALWSTQTDVIKTPPERIRLIEAGSRRAEAEAAAIETAAAVREGMRYRDIAVCTGSVDNYRGIIDSVFDAYAIPYHMSYRVRVEKTPEAAALFAALRVVTVGWRRDDIAAYIKTGLSGIGTDEEDELTLYLDMWNIGGRRFYDPDGGAWSMNPDGYTSTWTEEGERLLANVNASRRVVCEPLLTLAEAFSDETDAAVKTGAVRDFISRVAGDTDTVSSQLTDIVGGALTAIEVSSPPGPIRAQDYVSCLRLVIDTLSVGTIPGRTDETEISDAIGMRGAGHRLVIMLGVVDGELPAGGSEGFFSEADRLALEGEGLIVGEDGGYRAAMGLYNFSRCSADAEERLVLIYRTPGEETTSSVIERIMKICPAVGVKKFNGVTDAGDIYSEAGAASRFTRMEDAALRAAVTEELAESAYMRRALSGLGMPISIKYASLSESTARKLFGGDIYFSQTRLENYISCHFGFFCKYILDLSERQRANLDRSDEGSFVHAVLEKIFASGLIEREDVNEEEIEASADAVIADYIAEICPREEDTARLRGLFRRLRRSVLLFLRSFRQEFAQSRFRPVLFEVPFGIGDGMPPLRVPLEDGGCAYLRGVADRVDTYRDGNGHLYVRVIDYKTGKKSFSLSDIAEGHNLQLPLYLYTICADPDRKALGGESGDEVIPAGFLYVSVRPDDASAGVGANTVTEQTRKLPRRGIVLNDEEILRAQDCELSGDYIPVQFNRDGSLSKSSIDSVTDTDGFRRIYGELIASVRRISSELRSGAADAEPNTYGGIDPCKYCTAKAVCRREK